MDTSLHKLVEFLPRDAMHVTSRCSIETAERIELVFGM